jgi:hypothetical protein
MVWDKAVGHDFGYKPNLFLELFKEIAVVVRFGAYPATYHIGLICSDFMVQFHCCLAQK